jgi:hypothetical protein
MQRLTIIVFSLIVILVGAQAVSAQEPPTERNDRGPRGQIIEIVSEASGLEPAEVLDALRADENATLESVLLDAGADPDAVKAQIVATIMAENPDLDEANVTERVENLMTQSPPQRGDRGDRGNRGDRGDRGGFLRDLAEILEVDRDTMAEAIRAEETQTWADVITYLGGDPASIPGEIAERMVERFPSAEDIEARVQEWLTNDLPNRPDRQQPPAPGENVPPANDGDGDL